MPALLITRIVECARQGPAKVAPIFAPARELGLVGGLVLVVIPVGVVAVEDGEVSVVPLTEEALPKASASTDCATWTIGDHVLASPLPKKIDSPLVPPAVVCCTPAAASHLPFP